MPPDRCRRRIGQLTEKSRSRAWVGLQVFGLGNNFPGGFPVDQVFQNFIPVPINGCARGRIFPHALPTIESGLLTGGGTNDLDRFAKSGFFRTRQFCFHSLDGCPGRLGRRWMDTRFTLAARGQQQTSRNQRRDTDQLGNSDRAHNTHPLRSDNDGRIRLDISTCMPKRSTVTAAAGTPSPAGAISEPVQPHRRASNKIPACNCCPSKPPAQQ